MADLAPGLDHVLGGIGYVMQGDVEGIFVIAELDSGHRAVGKCLLLGINIVKISGLVAIGVCHSERRFKEVFIA